MNKKRIYLLGLGLTAGLATANLSVAEQADTNTDQVPEADLKEFNDLTILSRRVWLETEWNKFMDGTQRDFDSGEKEFQVNFVLTYYFR
jgi:hypothetical protein